MDNLQVTFGIFSNDITSHLPADLIEQTGRVYEVYVSDMIPTHCCEITPSYSMEFLRLESEYSISDELNEELDEISIESEDVYFHISNAMTRTHETETFTVTDDEDAEELFRQFKDTHQCNHTFSAFNVIEERAA